MPSLSAETDEMGNNCADATVTTGNNVPHDNPTANIDVGSELTTAPSKAKEKEKLPPQSEAVKWDAIASYTAGELTAPVYYDRDDAVQKPVCLSVMGFGVPHFPDVEKDEDVIQAVARTQSMMFAKTALIPSTNRAKPHLQKEVLRRCVTTSKEAPYPKPTNWTITQCIKWLSQNPPSQIEHEYIIESWQLLKKDMKAHFMEKSGGAKASTWRLVRLFECLLYPQFRNAYKMRHRQKDRPTIDAKNSHKLPKTFWQLVAELYNSDKILKSRALDKNYGVPFHEQVDLLPPGEKNFVTAESVEQRCVKFRGTFLEINDNISASGQGDGSHNGNTVKAFVMGPRASGKIANGDATGYGFIALKEEGEFYTFTSVTRPGVSATMDNVPRIDSATKRTTPSGSINSTAKKGKHINDKSPIMSAVNMLQRMERNMSLAEHKEGVSQLRFQISTEQTNLLNHNEKLSGFAEKYFSYKGMVTRGEIVEDIHEEEFEYFEICRFNYTDCKNRIVDVTENIKTIKEELEQCIKDYEEEKSKLAADNDDHIVKKRSKKKRVELDVRSIGSNDGSADFSDDDIPAIEQFC